MEELGPAVFPQIFGRTKVEPAPHHNRTATLMSWSHTPRQTRGIELRRAKPLARETATPLDTRTHSARASECSGTRQARAAPAGRRGDADQGSNSWMMRPYSVTAWRRMLYAALHA